MVDEVGNLAYRIDAANVLFHVVDKRLTRKPALLFTTSQPPKRWGLVSHDDDLADVIGDRTLDHGRLLRLDGTSTQTKHLAGDEIIGEDENHGRNRKRSGMDPTESRKATVAAANRRHYSHPITESRP